MLLEEKVVQDLVQHPVMTRLKGVRLLGTLYALWDVGKVSRYDHSVGCAALVDLFLDRYGIEGDDAYALLLAALLHDVGHTPLSHSTEVLLHSVMRRSHHGQTTVTLRNGNGSATPVTQVRDVVTSNLRNGETVFDKTLMAIRWMSQKNVVHEPLYDILLGPTNIDSLDAITRMAIALGKEHPDPRRILESFHYDRIKGITVDRNGLPLLEDFWRLKDSLYQEYIFESRNQAVEAMVSRAASIALARNGDKALLTRATDDELVARMQDDWRSQSLWNMIQRRETLVPMYGSLQVFRSRKGNATIGAALELRDRVEDYVAAELGVEESQRHMVIFHITTRKKFSLRGKASIGMLDVTWESLGQTFHAERRPAFNVK